MKIAWWATYVRLVGRTNAGMNRDYTEGKPVKRHGKCSDDTVKGTQKVQRSLQKVVQSYF